MGKFTQFCNACNALVTVAKLLLMCCFSPPQLCWAIAFSLGIIFAIIATHYHTKHQ